MKKLNNMLVAYAITLFLLLTSVAYGNDSASYTSGKAFAESLHSSVSLSDGTDIPHYEGSDVEESKLRASELSEEATRKTNDSKDDVGSSILDTQVNSLEYDYRLTEDDPLIKDGNTVVSDPLNIIGGTVSTKSKASEIIETTHTCEESAEAREYTCVRERVIHPKQESKKNDNTYYVHIPWNRVHRTSGTHFLSFAFPADHLELLEVPNGSAPNDTNWGMFKSVEIKADLRDFVRLKDKIPLQEDWHGYDKLGNALFDRSKIGQQYLLSWGSFSALSGGEKNLFLRVSFDPEGNFPEFLVQDRVVLEDAPDADEISDGCKALETLTEQGLCRYGEVRTIEGPGYRSIAFEGKTLRVHRDWWKKEFTYICKSPSKNNCDPFRKQGCEQIRSTCIKREGNVCVDHRKTFLCRSDSKGYEVTGFTGDIPFCLDGSCDDHSWTDNKDFADAMSKMAIFKEMQDDMDAKEATVFKGNEHQCNKDVLGFQDCCQGGGWGDGIGLAKKCSSSEKELRELKDQKQCVYVGTYCAEKILGICVRKKQSYCCFGSKLSKIVHEQGRKQLGIGWGEVEHPDCRPFTVDEIKDIDFSTMDLSELFEDLLNASNLNNMTASTEQMSSKWSSKIKSAKSIKKAKHETTTKAYFGLEGKDASL